MDINGYGNCAYLLVGGVVSNELHLKFSGGDISVIFGKCSISN